MRARFIGRQERMAKRHPSLVQLSRDHHHGLVLALRLGQGERALLTDGWTHDRREQARHVQRFYDEGLRAHFRAEEEVVFPAMTQFAPSSRALVQELFGEHLKLEALVSEGVAARADSLQEVLETFGDVLALHIRKEERELFPLFQAAVPEEAARRIGGEIEKVRGER